MKNLLKKINGSKDLTEGNPMKLILNFGLPLLFGLLFQQFYNMVDTIIVGKFLGVDALAAVGSTGSINFMILGFCIGICNGFAIPVAQAFGAKDTDNMKKYITNCVWASIFFAAVMTVAVGILTRNILIWMKTPDSILDQAFIYIFIIFMGIPATFLYNMVSGVIRSLGDSKTPVYFLLPSCFNHHYFFHGIKEESLLFCKKNCFHSFFTVYFFLFFLYNHHRATSHGSY